MLFVSILGEPSHHKVENFQVLCTSGLEKDWFFDWHGQSIREFGFELNCIDLCRGETLPPSEEIHSVIVGGSAHLINEKRSWLYDLTQWLKEYRKLHRPFLGICGGHQLVSTRIFNGNFAKRNTGTIAGTYGIELTDKGRKNPLFKGLPDYPRFHFANFLHVIPSAEMADSVLARHTESQAIAIDHGDNWYSVQFHPEATRQMLLCYCREDEDFNPAAYSETHDGPQLFRNFLDIAASSYG